MTWGGKGMRSSDPGVRPLVQELDNKCMFLLVWDTQDHDSSYWIGG